MHKVFIRPQWTITRPGAAAEGDALSPRLLTLLVQVAELGSLAAAAPGRVIVHCGLMKTLCMRVGT